MDTMKDIGFEMNVLFGGEPMLRPDILDIVSYAKKIELPYAFISNSTYINTTSVADLVASGLDNYTASVDTLKTADRRSADGVRAILEMKRAGVRDVVANVVVHRKNLQEIPAIVKFFSGLDVWVILGILQDCLSDEGWDYRSPSGLGLKQLPVETIEVVQRELLSLYDEGAKIHNVRSYIENMHTFGRKLNWKCSTPAYIPIDEDGSLMTCVDVRGNAVGFKEYHLQDLLNPAKRDQYIADRAIDVANCSGCYYNHSWQVEHLGNFDLAHR
jgi:MoaA/NifB/PqqE/SkfB family radical SAM enzyme